MVNIIINDYGQDDRDVVRADDEIVSILNDNIKMDVDLIEQVKELAKSNSLLVQHISKIEKDNEDLKGLIEQTNKTLDETLLELNIVKDYVRNDLTSLIENCDTKRVSTVKNKKEKETKPKKTKTVHKTRAMKDNEVYEPSMSAKKEWKNLELHNDGKIWSMNPYKRFCLPVNLNQLLYIQECDNKKMDRATAKLLMSKYNISYPIFAKIIYNLRETKNFDIVFEQYYSNLKKAKFSIKNNKLVVNKSSTNVSLTTAKEWIGIINNAGYKQKKILELQKANPTVDENIVRIICDSYNNSELLKLLKSVKKSTFVENNPSRRRNLIANGGLM